MKVHNKGKSSIQFGPDKKVDVLRPDQTLDIADDVAKKLLRLYPHKLVDVANIKVSDLKEPGPVQPAPDEADDAEDNERKSLFRGKKKAAE